PDFRRYHSGDAARSRRSGIPVIAQAGGAGKAACGRDEFCLASAKDERSAAMKVLLADDHALIRSGLRSELAPLARAVEFVAAWDAAPLRQAFAQHRDLDLALVDLTMPGMEGAATIGELRADFPAVPLVVVSGVDDAAQMQDVLRAGAAGYLPKTAMGQLV